MKTDNEWAHSQPESRRQPLQRRGCWSAWKGSDLRPVLSALLLCACGAEVPVDLGSGFGADEQGDKYPQGVNEAVAEGAQALTSGAPNVHQELNIPLAWSFRHTFKPPTTSPVTLRLDNAQGGANPMIAVLRWRSNIGWQQGSIDYSAQSAFDVVAFNDDFAAGSVNAQTSFVPDGRSHYTLLVMPQSQGQGTQPKARLTLSGCGTTCDLQQTVPVVGHTLRSARGNAFEIDRVNGSTTYGDPFLFAIRLFPTPGDARQYKGHGIANDQGRLGSNMPSVRTNFALEGRPWDLVFTTAWSYSPSTDTAHLMLGSDRPVIGLISRPQNTTCIAPEDASDIPPTIAETGCFDVATRQPVEGLIPYDVAHPFWSDGVHKERFLVVPDESWIYVDEGGKWHMPVGGMMIKNFYYNQALFETRFVVQVSSGAPLTYTYNWRAGGVGGAQRADLTAPTEILTGDPHLGRIEWTFPSTAVCTTCHSTTGQNDFFLGLNSRQFNTEMAYPETGLVADQLQTLMSVDLIKGPGLDSPPAGFEPRPDVPLGAAPSWEQARAFLDVNCAYCHNADYVSHSWFGSWDLGFDDLRACNVGNPLRIAPGSAANSRLFQRASVRDGELGIQMPRIATKHIDTLGMTLLSSWIDGMKVGNTGTCAPPRAALQLLTSPTATAECLSSAVRTSATSVGRNVSLAACNSSSAAQGFSVADDGYGITLRPLLLDPNAPPTLGDCLLYENNAIMRHACHTEAEWYRDYVPGGGFQLVHNETRQCLSKNGTAARLEICAAKDNQVWKTVPR